MSIVFLRTIILYLAIILGIRLLGKRQIGELQPSEFVITMLIAEIAAFPLQDNAIPLIHGLVALFTLVSLELIFSFASLKSDRLRVILSGKPSLLIHQGKVDENELESMRITLHDLFEELRMQNVLKISDVAYGILETNGKLSLCLYGEEDNKEFHGVVRIVIKGGKIIEYVAEKMGYSSSMILSQLDNRGVKLSDIFFATMDEHGKIVELQEKKARKKK